MSIITAIIKSGCADPRCISTLFSMSSEDFEDNVEMHLGSVLSTIIDYVVLMTETIEGLKNKFLKWKEAFESKSLKVNLGKTKVMDSGGITKVGLSKSKVDPCWICSLRLEAKSILCAHWGKLIHGRCEPKFLKKFCLQEM